MSFNKVVLMGNLTRDPEMKVTKDGLGIANFTLAINNKMKEKEDVSFIDCVSFGKQADFVGKFLTKGIQILVEGRLKQDRWEQDGQKRSRINVLTESISFTGPKRDGGGGSVAKDEGYSRAESYDESDIPF